MEVIDIDDLIFPILSFPKNRSYHYSMTKNQFRLVSKAGLEYAILWFLVP